MEAAPGRPGAFARFVHGLAVAGGLVSLGLALMVVASVALRSGLIGLSGVPGDFELVQMLTAVSVFCFLPLCQARGGHVIVDVATRRLPERVCRRIDGLWELVAAAVMGLVAVQLAQGAFGIGASGTRTMVLGLPVAPAVGVCAALALVLAGIALRRGILGLGGDRAGE